MSDAQKLVGKCDLCGKVDLSYRITKQIGGKFYLYDVCPTCHKEHERELELTRENFRRQFGEN